MITIDSLTKRYGKRTVVDDVSFAANSGRVTGFLGPNGAGKSTSMRMMVGLTTPTSGRATIRGRRFADLPNPGLEVGVMLDASAQHAGRTGREILTLAQRFMGLPARRVDESIEAVGLTERLAVAAGTLSYGEQRQLEIGVALATSPRVLLLDEPTAGMSPEETHRMTQLLAGLPREVTLLIIEHDMDVVFSLADRITVLHHGEVLAEGAPDEVRADARVYEVYLGTGDGE